MTIISRAVIGQWGEGWPMRGEDCSHHNRAAAQHSAKWNFFTFNWNWSHHLQHTINPAQNIPAHAAARSELKLQSQ